MNHPLARLGEATERKLVLGLLVASAVLGGVLGYGESHNVTNVAPLGIVSFQLAGKPLMSQLILEKWRALPDGTFWVSFGLYTDFAFMLVYTTLFALLALRLGRRLETRDPANARVAGVVAWLATLALPLDLLENVAHLRMLAGGATETYTPVAFYCAIAKFACLGAFVVFALVSAIMLAATKPTTRPDPV